MGGPVKVREAYRALCNGNYRPKKIKKMLVKDYQYIQKIPTGATYETQLIDYLKIDKSQTIEKVEKDLSEKLKVTQRKFIPRRFRIGRKLFTIEKDFLDCSFEQFSRLDSILAEEDNIANLHKLIAIYCRPFCWWRLGIQKYDLRKQDKIAEQILEMDMGTAQALILFFYLNAQKSLRHMSISFLMQMKKMNTTVPTKSK